MGNVEEYNYMYISKMIEEKGIKTLPVHIPFNVIDNSILILKQEDFMSFLVENQVHQVFIHEQYVENDDYMISEETFRKVGVRRDSLEYLEKIIEEYNEVIDSTEFEIPEIIIVLFIWNGQRFYYLFQNEIFIEGEILLSAEDKLVEMIMLNERGIIDAKEAKKKLIEQQQETLRTYIINDPKFRVCTNNRLRRNYVIEIFTKRDKVPKELKDLWLNSNGFLYQGAYDFIEGIWKEIKGK